MLYGSSLVPQKTWGRVPVPDRSSLLYYFGSNRRQHKRREVKVLLTRCMFKNKPLQVRIWKRLCDWEEKLKWLRAVFKLFQGIRSSFPPQRPPFQHELFYFLPWEISLKASKDGHSTTMHSISCKLPPSPFLMEVIKEIKAVGFNCFPVLKRIVA